MQHTVVLNKTADSVWRAFAPFLPECTVEAATREEALARIRESIAAAQADFEVVQLDVPQGANGAPRTNGASGYTTFEQEWPDFGSAKNDPFHAEVWDEIERRRDELMNVWGQTVEVTQTYGKDWWARVLEHSECEVLAPTREEALAKIEVLIKQNWPLEAEVRS